MSVKPCAICEDMHAALFRTARSLSKVLIEPGPIHDFSIEAPALNDEIKQIRDVCALWVTTQSAKAARQLSLSIGPVGSFLIKTLSKGSC